MSEPTIVIAKLDDKQLKDSVQSMVTDFQQQLEKMVNIANAKVTEINTKLSGIKYDVGDSSDGSMSKQKKAQEEYVESVKRSTAEVKIQNKEVEMSFDQMAAAQQKVAQATQQTTQSAQRYTEEIKRQEGELSRLKSQRQALLNAETVPINDATTQKIERLNQELKKAEIRLSKLKDLSILSIDDSTRKDFTKSAVRAAEVFKSKINVSKMSLEEILKLTSTGSEKFDKYIERTRRQFGAWNSEAIKLAENRIASLNRELTELDSQRNAATKISNNSQKISEIDSQIAAKEKEIAETKERINALTQQQTNAATKNTQETQRYTEEVRKQAAAIREMQTWKEKGYAVVNGQSFYDPESSKLPKKDRLTLEEQILQTQKAQEEESARQAQAQATVTEAVKGTAKMHENVHEAAKRQNEWARKGGFGASVFQRYDDLRDSMAAVLGIQRQQIRFADTETASYNQLNTTLKQLKQTYDRLSKSDINSTQGESLIYNMQQIQREMQKIQAKASRPVNLGDALGLPEKTLDDIAYKMRQLASYRSGLNIKTQTEEIDQVNRKYAELQKKMNEVMQKNSQMIASNTALGRSWNYMKNRLAFYFTVGASTQFVKNLIDIRSQYEMNERALGVLIDSAERGTQIFNELSQMALVSPYTLIELSTAAKQLTAYDVAAKDVVDTTRRLADMAAAVGVPIERLTYALGQIKAYGYLNSRDARMFANAGIPLVKQLSDHYTELEGKLVSVSDIYDRIKKKQIGYEDVTEVIYKMTDEGGKFFDFQAKMAETLKVQLANLTLAWNNMLNDIGESNQWLLSGGIGALKELFLQWENISRVLTNVVVTFGIAKASMYLLNLAMGKGTLETIKRIGALEGVTAANYRDIVSTGKLTATQARFLIATNRSNDALRKAIVHTGILTKQQAAAAASSKLFGLNLGFVTRSFKALGLTGAVALQGLWTGIKSIGASLLSIATNPLFIAMTAAMAVTDAIMYYNQVAEKTEELNNNIAKGAKEASEALTEFLKDTVNISNRAKAVQGILSASEGEKTWTALREQIELSSDAASTFITELLSITDINERIAKGFDYAESIKDATNALAGLNAEALNVNQDSWLYGLFGEGLAEDMEDYIEAVKGNIGFFKSIIFDEDPKEWRDEAISEIQNFANNAADVIKDRLGDAIYDPETGAVQLKEAVERLKKEVIAANPQIKNEVKKFFDVELDTIMADKFSGVYDRLSSVQQLFVEHIKRDSGSALKRLSDEILDTSKQLDDNVTDAIEKAWKKLQDELPEESQSLISELQKRMDENPLYLRVLLLEAGEQQIRDKIQKDYEKHFYDDVIGEKPQRPKSVGTLWGDFGGDYNAYAAAQKKHEADMVEYNRQNAAYEEKRAQQAAKYGEFNKKNDEDRAKWAKRITDYIKEQETQEKSALHTKEEVRKELGAQLSEEELLKDVRYAQAKADAEKAASNKKNAEEAYRYEHLYNEEKKKSGGSKKDPLLDALKQEISLVEKLQGDYDKLTKSGASQADALDTIRGAYGKTIRLLNAQLSGYGLPQLDLAQLITGKDPHKALEHFRNTLNTLVDKGILTLERSKELEAVIEKMTLSVKTYDLDKITKGLNNELGKLKDEYELAVELDANPELGSMFADMWGLNLETLPHTAKEYVERMTTSVNKFLKDKKADIELPNLLSVTNDDLKAFQDMVDAGTLNATVYEEIVKNVKVARDAQKKEFSDTRKEWETLLSKYAEYEHKMTQVTMQANKERVTLVRQFGKTDEQKSQAIQLEARILAESDPSKKAELIEQLKKLVNDISSDNDVAMKLKVAIDNKELQEGARVAFEEFQKSPEWILATGDLAGMTDKAIGGLIVRLSQYKKSAKNLDPKQIKQINNALKSLYKQQRQGNPFAFIANAIDEAKEREAEYDDAIVRTSNEISALNEVQVKNGKLTKEQSERLEKLKETLTDLIKGKEDIGKIDAAQLVEGINSAIAVAQQATGIFTDMLSALGNEKAVRDINRVFSVIDKAGQGAAMGAQIGGGWGAVIGGVAGGLSGLVTTFADQWSGNKAITENIQESERAVKRLELAYKELEYAIADAYGTAILGARKVVIENKKIQLQELKRQLSLEESRSGKHKDEDKIIDLKGQIIDLEHEIKDFTDELANSLLGISSVGDAAERMMSAYINALRSGDDAMKAFNDNIDDMIANMVMKMMTTKIIQPWLEKQWGTIQNELNARGAEIAKDIANEQAKMVSAKYADTNNEDSLTRALRDLGYDEESLFDMWWQQLPTGSWVLRTDRLERLQKAYEEAMSRMDSNLDELNSTYKDVTAVTMDDIKRYAELLRSGQPILDENMKSLQDLFGELGIMNDDTKDNLSALQQGINGVSEETASALEGYMNGVSQQVYLQSHLLTEIRDILFGGDSDIQMGVQAQMLLQLQQSYQVQMSIQSILEGALVPSGRAFAVELIS